VTVVRWYKYHDTVARDVKDERGTWPEFYAPGYGKWVEVKMERLHDFDTYKTTIDENEVRRRMAALTDAEAGREPPDSEVESSGE